MNRESKKSKKTEEDLTIDMKFNENFHPGQSRRNASRSTYNGMGQIRATGRDACDCLDNNCVGCHFPCPSCKSPKCGHECRQHRDDYVKLIQKENGKIICKNHNFKWDLKIFRDWILFKKKRKVKEKWNNFFFDLFRKYA